MRWVPMVEERSTPFLTAEELAEQLRRSPVTVREWARNGQIRSYRAGRTWLFDLVEVRQDLRRNSLSGLTVPIEVGESIR